MTPKKQYYKNAAETVIKNLEKRRMEGYYCETKEEAVALALSLMPKGSSIGWGGSMTLTESGLMDAIKNGDYELIDRSGDVPKATMNLLNIALVRSAAMKCGVTSIVEDTSEVKIYPEEFDMEIWSMLSDAFKNRLRVLMGEKVSVAFRFNKEENLPTLMYKLFTKYLEFEAEISSQNVDK